MPLLGFYTTSQPIFEQFWPFHSLVRHSSADKCLTLVILYYSRYTLLVGLRRIVTRSSILGNQRFLSSVSPSWIIFGGGHIGTWGCMLAAPIPDRNIFALWQENPTQQLNTEYSQGTNIILRATSNGVVLGICLWSSPVTIITECEPITTLMGARIIIPNTGTQQPTPSTAASRIVSDPEL